MMVYLNKIHLNKAVRQGCGLSPVLFNINVNKNNTGIQNTDKEGYTTK